MHGRYEAYQLNGTISQACPRCTDAASARADVGRRERHAQRMRSDKLKSLRSISRIPKHFADATLADYRASSQAQQLALAVCKGYLDTWPEQCTKGGALSLIGRQGTGKTHLACAIGNGVLSEYMGTVAFGTMDRLIREVRSTWHRDSNRTETQVLDSLAAMDLLIVDEIGAKPYNEDAIHTLFEIIDQRDKEDRATIITSNLTQSELTGYIGERAMDRLQGRGPVIAFTWDSYRTTKQGELC